MIQYFHERPSPSEYNDLRKEVGWAEIPELGIEAGLSNTLFSVIAKENNSVVGMGRVIGDGAMVFYIQDIIVLPSHQRKGIGKEIMKAIMEFIGGKSIVNTTIGLMAAAGKESFYEQFGFVQRPTAILGAGMTIFVKGSTHE